MKKFCIDLTVLQVQRVNARYVLIKLTHSQPLPEMLPGQFVEVRVDGSPSTFLRRPISIHNVDYARNELHLLVAIVGEGTRHLAQLSPCDQLNCVLPLGKPFTLPTHAEERFLLVGGGVGTAPLLFLGKKIAELGAKPSFLLGARTATDLLPLADFEHLGRVFVTTEDGTAGEQGFVVHHSVLKQETFDRICTCGPTPMMKAVAGYAAETGTECEASLENLMACGVGACLCCVEKTTHGNLCVCTDGPVFNTKELLWQN